MPSAQANGCRIYYEVHGAGPDVVFLHGENHNVDMFADQVAELADRYRCITYSRRGHGKSEAPPYGYSLNNQVLDLASLLATLDVTEPVIVAVAMGTPIAVSYALEESSHVRGLVLVSWYELDGYPATEVRRRDRHPMTFPELNLRLDEVQQVGGIASVAGFIDQESAQLFPIFPNAPAIRRRLIKMFADQPPGRYIHAAEYYTSLPNLVPDLSRLGFPIMGVCGEDDPSPDRPELLAGLRNFHQVWVPGARRFAMMETPHAFNTILSDFLDALIPHRSDAASP